MKNNHDFLKGLPTILYYNKTMHSSGGLAQKLNILTTFNYEQHTTTL